MPRRVGLEEGKSYFGNCIVCGTKACECRTSIARYIQLLCQAAARCDVSSDQGASNIPRFEVSGCIDKLTGTPTVLVRLADVLARAKDASIPTERIRLRGKGFYTQLGPKDAGWYIRDFSGVVRQVITRPSFYNSEKLYSRDLGKVLSPHEIASIKISRIDFAVDYKTELLTILGALDVRHKRCQNEYVEVQGTTSRLTGIRIGKGSEKLSVYDKQLHHGGNAVETRLELQLSGRNLPIKKFSELDQLPSALDKFQIFEKVILGKVKFVESTVPGSANAARLERLRNAWNLRGFLSARHALNANGNFARDYGQLFEYKPWDQQPSDVIRSGIEKFLR